MHKRLMVLFKANSNGLVVNVDKLHEFYSGVGQTTAKLHLSSEFVLVVIVNLHIYMISFVYI